MTEFLIFKKLKNKPKRCANTLPALTTQPETEAVMAESKVCNSTVKEQEVWKPIKGFKKFYSISNKGRVKSFHPNKTSIRKAATNPKGYKLLTLTKRPEIRETYTVHRLVAEHFLPNPDNKREINHKDGDPSNNHVENLEWATSSENTLHSYNNGLQKRGESFYAAKLTELEAIEIINAYRIGVFSQSELAKAYNISKSSIKDLLSGRNWAHLGIQDEIRVRQDRVCQY